MSTHKIIYWRDDIPPNEKGERFANVHLLVGYTSESITAFQKMAEEMRKTFPMATDDKVRCGKVRKSRSVENFSIIAFDGHIPEKNTLAGVNLRTCALSIACKDTPYILSHHDEKSLLVVFSFTYDSHRF